MKVVRLTAENYKRLRAVEIVPDGDTVVIAGRNAQGKSSVLDAIWAALGGAAASKPTTRPIRDGETKASVVLDLGDIVVERKWTQKASTLVVTSADGTVHKSPQGLLDSLVGRLSFDPLAFASQPPREQVATLISLADLPFNPDELAAQRQRIFDERTAANRERKALEARVLALPALMPGVPDVEVSAAAIADELDDLRVKSGNLQALRDRHGAIEQEISALKLRIAELGVEQADIVERGQVLAALVDDERIEALRQQLAVADETNAQVRRKHERKRMTDELRVIETTVEKMTEQIDGLDRYKAEALAAAKLPVAGLSFDDSGVLYNGVPFSQASAAERLRVSVAMAMAMNPNVRVIRILDGSLLDSDNMRLISEMAAEHDFQVWIERVDETGTIGVVIEDGMVAP